MSYSEMLAILVYYHPSGYRTFKWFYQKCIQANWRPAFPLLLSYNRLVETMPELLVPLAAFMQSRCGRSQGIAFIDSTPLAVCKNIRIPRHKTFKGEAGTLTHKKAYHLEAAASSKIFPYGNMKKGDSDDD